MTVRLVLVGGGLANSLIAYRLTEIRPDVEVRLLDARAHLGQSQIWSFHGSDLTPAQHAWIAPLVARDWAGHEVRFPSHSRAMNGSYHTITAELLDRRIRERLGARLSTGTRVASLSPTSARLEGGGRLEANVVIDGRGAAPSAALRIAYQKFVGLHVELEDPIELASPILMDATVTQRDGFRFIYTLPFGPTSLLIEDTRYSDGSELDPAGMRVAVLRYAERQGWRVRSVVSEEEGALPIVLSGDIQAFWRQAERGVPRSGMRAALFHPTTGYSLPEAVRLADALARLADLTPASVDHLIRERSVQLWRSGGFYRLLNRMLFLAAEPRQRYRVLERFYRLPEPLIERFYAGRSTVWDRIRILTGRPPVPIGRALACLMPRAGVNPTAAVRRR